MMALSPTESGRNSTTTTLVTVNLLTATAIAQVTQLVSLSPLLVHESWESDRALGFFGEG